MTRGTQVNFGGNPGSRCCSEATVVFFVTFQPPGPNVLPSASATGVWSIRHSSGSCPGMRLIRLSAQRSMFHDETQRTSTYSRTPPVSASRTSTPSKTRQYRICCSSSWCTRTPTTLRWSTTKAFQPFLSIILCRRAAVESSNCYDTNVEVRRGVLVTDVQYLAACQAIISKPFSNLEGTFNGSLRALTCRISLFYIHL